MAFTFSGSTQYITLADNPAYDIPNSDWTWAGWVQCSSRTGTGVDVFISGTSGYFWFGLYDTSHGTKANKMGAQFFSDESNFIEVYETTASWSGDTSAHHIALRRSGNTYTLWKDGVSVGSATSSSANTITFNRLDFGNRISDGGGDYFRGDMWEWGYWTRALADDEIVGLYKKAAPSQLPYLLKVYAPMVREYVEVVNNIAVTNNSTTVSAHRAMFYPSATLVGKTSVSTQNVLPPLISGNTQLYAPTFVPGAFTIQPPAIASSATLYTPTLTLSAIAIVAPLLDSSAVLYNPSLSVGSVTLTPPAIDSTVVLYEPELINAAQQNLDIPFISSSETLYTPTLTVGEVTISIPIIDSVTVLYEPTIAPGELILSPPLISSTTTFYSPTITATYSINMPFISSQEQLYDPTFIPSTLTVTIPFISGGTALYAPAFIFGQSLSMPVISGNTVLHAPAISFSFFFVEPSGSGFSQVNPNTNTDFTLVI